MRGHVAAFLGLLDIGLACTGHAGHPGRSTLPPELEVLGAPSQVLDVKFPIARPPHMALVLPGEFVEVADTSKAPTVDIHSHSPHHQGTFLYMMVDPDINTTAPTYVGLHTLVADVSAHHGSTPIASYIGPEPPAGEAHNYTFLAFHQPPHFSIPQQYAPYVATTAESPLNRINFPLQEFIADMHLGPIVAANWFQAGDL